MKWYAIGQPALHDMMNAIDKLNTGQRSMMDLQEGKETKQKDDLTIIHMETSERERNAARSAKTASNGSNR